MRQIDSKLSILMLAPFGIRPKGTLSARMLPLAQALVRRSHQVTIVAPPVQNPEDAGSEYVYDRVPVIHTRQPSWPGPAGFAEQVLLMLHQLHKYPYDCVHLFKPKGYGGLAMQLAQVQRRQHTPLVVDSDDWEGWGGWNELLPYPAWAKQMFAWQEADLPRRAAAVTVVSRTLALQMRGFGVAPERIFHLPNGTRPLTALVRSDQPGAYPVVLLYTRFWEFSIPFLVEVLRFLVRGCPTLRLVVVGKGERGEEGQLLQQVEQAGLARALEYRGWLVPETIPAALAEADLALAPLDDTLINRARGLAKLLELMQAGLPVVANRVGAACDYLVHGESGLLVPPGDAQAFAEAVLLLANEQLRQRIGEGARRRAAQFDWDVLAETAETAYWYALGQR